MSSEASAHPDRLAERAGTAVVWRTVNLAGTRALGLVRTLVLARLLTPEDFGLLAMAVAPMEFLLGATSLGIVPALVQRAHLDARDYHAAWTLGLVRGLLVGAAMAALAPVVGLFVADPRVTPVLQVLALKPVIESASSIRVADLERQLQFRGLSLIALVAALAGVICAILLSPAFRVWGMVAGLLTASLVSTVLSYVIAPGRPRLLLARAESRTLIAFGRWIALSGLTYSFGTMLLRAVIARQLGTAELGLFFLAAGLALIPTELAANILRPTVFRLHAQLRGDDLRACSVFAATVTALAVALLPSYALLIALAPALVERVLGPQWNGAAPLIQLVAIAGAVSLLVEAAEPLLEGRGMPQRATALHATFALVVMVAGWLLAKDYGLIGYAGGWLIGEMAVVWLAAALATRALPHALAGLARVVTPIAAAAVVGGATASVLVALLPGVLGLTVSGATACMVALVALLAADRWLDLRIGTQCARAFPGAGPVLERFGLIRLPP